LGGFIGVLVSLEIASAFALGEFFWIIGTIFGGVISYLAYDFSEAKEGVSYAYQEVTAWRPDTKWWSTFIKALLLFTSAIFVMFSTVSFYFILSLCFLFSTDPVSAIVAGSFKGGVFFGLFALIAAAGFVFLDVIIINDIKYSYKEGKELWMIILKEVNPIFFPFAVLYFTARGIIWSVSEVQAFVMAVGRFVKKTFIYIHSEERILCLVDGSLGATIGFFFESAILGGVAGLVFGVINYEIVSKRLLSLEKISK